MTQQLPDAATATEALARLTLAVMALPDDASSVDTTIGRRAPSAGGGWYWGVTHVVGIGPAHKRVPFTLDREQVIIRATSQMLDAIERVEQRDAEQ